MLLPKNSVPFEGLYCSNVSGFNNRHQFVTAQLLKQRHQYHKVRKAVSKFYHRPSELILKYNVDLKTLLQQGILDSVLNSDLGYNTFLKNEKNVVKPTFTD